MMLAEDELQEEISVPPELRKILAEYAKAALREKPVDLLEWSAVYFRALANNEEREKKESLHLYAPFASVDGLHAYSLRALFFELHGQEEVVSTEILKTEWKDLGLDIYLLFDLFKRMGISCEVEAEVSWMKILALGAGLITQGLKATMALFISTVSEDYDKPRLLFSQMEDTFRFLAEVDEIPPSDVQNTLEYLREVSEKQNGYVFPKNFYKSTVSRHMEF